MKKNFVALCLLGASLAVGAAPFKDGDTVVFFGDSITHGGRYHEFLTDYYRTRFPEAEIRFVNSGIGGDTAAGSRIRIPEDITEYAPTHVCLHFGMNDIARGAYSNPPTLKNLMVADKCQLAYRRNLTNLIARIRAAVPSAQLVCLTTTPYDDTAIVTNIPPTAAAWAKQNNRGVNVGLALAAGFVAREAEANGLPYVDWYTPLQALVASRRKADPHFMFTVFDRTHPTALGHAIMAWTFLEAQGAPAVVSEVTVDAVSLQAPKADNAAVSGLVRTPDGLAFSLAARALPFPVAEEALPYVAEYGVERKLNRETLTVTGLAPGRYALAIDGAEVGSWSADAFAQGVGLGFNPKTPQYRQAQRVFAAVAELRQREAKLRNNHSARWCYGNQGAPVNDVTAFADWFERNVKDKNKNFARFVPGYLEYWPHYRETRAQLWADQRKVRELAIPSVRRYELRQVASGR